MLLIARRKRSRVDAREIAEFELLSLLAEWNPVVQLGGPFGSKPGMSWIELLLEPRDERWLTRLTRASYVEEILSLEPMAETEWRRNNTQYVRWRKEPYRVRSVFESDAAAEAARAPDQRQFLLPDGRDGARLVRGYRGSGSPSTRRALPVVDSRLLVNLAAPASNSSILDPFAGAGGIIVEAELCQLSTTSVDIDPFVAPGLHALSGRHAVADACALPFGSESFEAIATEPPFHDSATPQIILALAECRRVLVRRGRIAMLVAETQAEAIAEGLKAQDFTINLSSRVNRKGTPCWCFAARSGRQDL